MNQYDRLISQLDAFIRKYYANKVIRGSLLFISSLLAYILLLSIGEYFLYLPVWIKISVLSVLVLVGGAALVMMVIVPLTKMWRLGNLISHEEAARIIGKHFGEVDDKLLNILQLKNNADPHASIRLLEASIEQKSKQLVVVPFANAIEFRKNRKYLPYLLPVVLIMLFILVAAPNVFKEASGRLLQPTKRFERPAPFSFIVKSALKVRRNADLDLRVETRGNALPGEMFVEAANEMIPMSGDGKHGFAYTFRNISESIHFRFYAAGYYSEPYTIEVLQQPVLKSFKVQLNYPAYTGKHSELRNNMGDMSVPVGTQVNWVFMAEHTDEAYFKLGNGMPQVLPRDMNLFRNQFRFLSDTDYRFILVNKSNGISDSYHYSVQVIPDQYPVVQVQDIRDTVNGKQIVLNGTAGDDYGISKVEFHYDINDSKKQAKEHKTILLKSGQGLLCNFQHYFDVEEMHLQAGDELSYYIEVWDNDGVHGPKSSRSDVMTYKMYDEKQLDSAINANSQQINSGLSKSAQRSKQMQSEIKDMQTKMLQSDKMDWEEQQFMQEMAKKQEQLQHNLEQIKKRFDEQKEQTQQKPFSEDLKNKQEQLDKQLDNLLNKELKEQMKKLEELMKQLNKEEAFKQMQQMEEENKLFNMDMQRMQELMKQLEMQMRMEDLANKMDELAKKENDLKAKNDKQTEATKAADKKDAKAGNEALKKEQEEIKKEFDKAMDKEMKEMKELNSKMKDNQMPEDATKDAKEAQENMQQSEDDLEKSENSKASESQKKAAENMQHMAQQMMQAAGGMSMKQIEIDIKATRQLLTNLIRLSFEQEDLMKQVQHTSIASQQYLSQIQDEKRLHGNSLMIKDSLFVLSKRIAQLSASVNKETTELEKNMNYSVNALEDRKVSEALTRQQYVMTHTNNLALMLNELLANLMEARNQGQKPGSQSCNNPGGMKPKPGQGKPKQGMGMQMQDIITKQQNLGNAMKQMQDAKQKRQGEGEKQDGKGQKPGNGEGGGNGNGKNQNGDQQAEHEAEELARLAQQQSALRRQIQELTSLLNSKGMGNAKMLQEIQQKMDKNETDIVNRRLSAEMQLRQQEIMTRLLEAQKSMREQEQDDKRSSNTAKEISRPIPAELQKYINDRQHMLELYKTVPPQLKPYYRSMVEQYFKSIGK